MTSFRTGVPAPTLGPLSGPATLARPGPWPHRLRRCDMAKRTCNLDGCDNPHDARGWCRVHYQRWRRYGDPLGFAERTTTAERFWSKVDTSDRDGCWLWTASHHPAGYGQFYDGDRLIYAHRFAYEHLVGPIPAGLHIDHLCRTPACVRPDHLEPVTNRENNLRGVSPAAANARVNECKNGHPYDLVNTYWRPDGKRDCRTCKRERLRKFRAEYGRTKA